MVHLKKVIAEGKVRVTQGGRVATGVKAVFNSQDNTISLVGNPLVRQGKNQVSGSRIILFINEDRVVVEGGARRVKAVIFPEDLGK
jgi:lipopolysaccharide export system protein LptA